MKDKEKPIDYIMTKYGATCKSCGHIMFYGNDVEYEDSTYIGNYCDGCGQKQTKKRDKKNE